MRGLLAGSESRHFEVVHAEVRSFDPGGLTVETDAGPLAGDFLGQYDVDQGATFLTSPSFDLTSATNPREAGCCRAESHWPASAQSAPP